VKISSCSDLEDISDLGNNKVVSISWCSKIQSFSALQRVPHVSIDHCHGFRNGRDVQYVTKLVIEECPNFTDPSMLGKVRYLSLAAFVSSFQELSSIPILEIRFNPAHVLPVDYWKSLGNGRNQKIFIANEQFPFEESDFDQITDFHIIPNRKPRSNKSTSCMNLSLIRKNSCLKPTKSRASLILRRIFPLSPILGPINSIFGKWNEHK
jgi:hypothetical protein